MISLEEHYNSLMNLPVTITAIEDIDRLIIEYSNDVPGPAYTMFEFDRIDGIRVQLRRSIALAALRAQRAVLEECLNKLGIAVNTAPA